MFGVSEPVIYQKFQKISTNSVVSYSVFDILQVLYRCGDYSTGRYADMSVLDDFVGRN